MKPLEIVSLDFFIFTTITLVIYHVLAPRAQVIWLLVVSCFFYATWSISHLAVLFFFAILNFSLARQIEKTRSQTLFTAGLILNLGSFFSIKLLAGPYGGRLLDALNQSAWEAIILPVGFSFYSLQLISYLTDVYRGQIKSTDDFVHFVLYLVYFPKILSGPIERAKIFLPQLQKDRRVDNDAIEQGIYLIILGLLRKIVIADHLSRLRPANIFSQPESYTPLERMIWVIIYAFILYNDFAGYTSIIRGISCFFGIHLSPNFRQPFFSASFSNFWTRWHISLSEWLRDYIFYPARRWLMPLRINWLAVVVPPLATMLFSGFWHGASLALLFWGFLHGLYLIFEQILHQMNLFPKKVSSSQLYKISVFVLITLAWIPFNTPSVRSAGRYFVGLFKPYSGSFDHFILPDLILLIFLSLWLDWQEGRHNDLAFPRKWSSTAQTWGTALAIILIVLFASEGNDLSHFVYQFF